MFNPFRTSFGQAPVNSLVTPSLPHRAVSPIPLTHSVPYYCPSNTIFNLPPPLAQLFPTGLLSFLWTAFFGFTFFSILVQISDADSAHVAQFENRGRHEQTNEHKCLQLV
jgi:hypothetical protein